MYVPARSAGKHSISITEAAGEGEAGICMQLSVSTCIYRDASAAVSTKQ